MKKDNANVPPKKQVAAAVRRDAEKADIPRVTAAGYGYWAERIVDLAFENGIKVREDPDLARLLATIELESPIPAEALLAVAEILAYAYKANGQPDPFHAILEEIMESRPAEDDYE